MTARNRFIMRNELNSTRAMKYKAAAGWVPSIDLYITYDQPEVVVHWKTVRILARMLSKPAEYV